MLAQLVSVALTASVKATDTKSVSSFNHFPFKKLTLTQVKPQSTVDNSKWGKDAKQGLLQVIVTFTFDKWLFAFTFNKLLFTFTVYKNLFIFTFDKS